MLGSGAGDRIEEDVCCLVGSVKAAPEGPTLNVAPIKDVVNAGLSARTITVPVPPAARAVVMGWASSRPAPEAEAAFPRRNRAAASTGIAVSVDRAASWTFRPRWPV